MLKKFFKYAELYVLILSGLLWLSAAYWWYISDAWIFHNNTYGERWFEFAGFILIGILCIAIALSKWPRRRKKKK